MNTATQGGSARVARDEQALQAERRSSIRWRGDAPRPVHIACNGQSVDGKIKDISAGGAALLADQPVAAGTKIVVEINDAVRLPGTVLRAGGGAMAVKFDLPAHLALQIDRAIQLGLSPAEW